MALLARLFAAPKQFGPKLSGEYCRLFPFDFPAQRLQWLAMIVRRTHGMTLVEVMIAFAILVVGLVGVFALINGGTRAHKRAINETESSLVASSVAAEMRAEFFRGRVPASDAANAWHDSPDYPRYQYRKLITPLDPGRKGADDPSANREYFVRIIVRWSEHGEDKSISMDTIMYNNRK
jgi:type II secretory pathway pseudopilin PulG